MNRRVMLCVRSAAFVHAALLASPIMRQPEAPARAAVDGLLAQDRAFSAASAKAANVIDGLLPMFAEDVAVPVPPGRFTTSKADVAEALRANADNLAGRAEWAPVRGGVSGDGRHGFTFGYMTVRRFDAPEIRLKYLAYWIKTPSGWRVAVYRRRPRAEGPVSLEMTPPSLPERWVGAASNASGLEAARQSLDQAERAFSTEAQSIGLGAAFTKWGREDAVNLGPPDVAGFIVGAAAIGKSVGDGTPTNSSPVSWTPDRVLVASSGDLGVTMGMIRSNGPGPDGTPAPPVPFFTIWKRDGPNAPWRYIAE